MKRVEARATDWIKANTGIGASGIIVNLEDDRVERAARQAFEAGYRLAIEDAAKCVLTAELRFKNAAGQESALTDISHEGQSLKKHMARAIRAVPDQED